MAERQQQHVLPWDSHSLCQTMQLLLRLSSSGQALADGSDDSSVGLAVRPGSAAVPLRFTIWGGILCALPSCCHFNAGQPCQRQWRQPSNLERDFSTS